MTGPQLARIVAAVLAVLAALQVADPSTFGLPPQTPAWAGLIATGLGALGLALPPVQGAPKAEGE